MVGLEPASWLVHALQLQPPPNSSSSYQQVLDQILERAQQEGQLSLELLPTNWHPPAFQGDSQGLYNAHIQSCSALELVANSLVEEL